MSARFLILCSLILTLLSCSEPKVKLSNPSIIPAPQSLLVNSGYFTMDPSTLISNTDDFTHSVDFLKSFLEVKTNRSWETKYATENVILFEYDATITATETYTLEINAQQIIIRASTDTGAFYAVQTLIQLLPVETEKHEITDKIQLPAVTVKDQPRFSYRGMHLDVSRHLFDVKFIKKYIDAMAMLKMNSFHWHLTDDQGWRIEIKKYPKLQEVAAYRDSTLIGHYNDSPRQYDNKKYGGFYTQEEIREVIAFAKTRHINIIPEIEMPGHAQAAIAAYPELGCTGQKIGVATEWGVFEDIYCPNEATFTFLENVLDEVMELFPSTYIHIGGDEAPKTQWKTSDIAQQVIKENSLKDEAELQSYFIQRMEKYVNSKGRHIIGWDEILEGGLAPNAIVMSWRGTAGAVEAAKAGHDVIMTPTSHSYFDYYQSENDNEPTAIGGFLPLEKVYHFQPIPKELTAEEAKHILGPQGNIWTEYMTTSDQVEYMAFPRMLAMSEVAWTAAENKDYASFINRVEYFHKRMDEMDINYANHLYELKGSFNESQEYELQTLLPHYDIRYTLDGTEPTATATLYKAPIPFTANMTLKAAVFNEEKQIGRLFTQEFLYHKAVGANISINKEPHKSYPGSGAAGLINGIKGSDSRYGDSEWLGFWGDDIEIEITFKESIDINEIQLRFYNAPGQWIYAPTHIVYLTSEMPGEKVYMEKSKENSYNLKIDQLCALDSIKLFIPNYGTIPDGKQGAGNKAWTFIDEIIIN